MGTKLGRATIVLVTLVMGGCSRQSEPVRACEAQLLPTLKAPSTYKLIESTVGLQIKDGTQDVLLRYDAANTYNTPIRSVFWCEFNPSTGSAEQHDDSEIQADNMEAIADTVDAVEPAAARPSSNAGPPEDARASPETFDDGVPVCDRPDSPEKFALMNEIGVDCAPH